MDMEFDSTQIVAGILAVIGGGFAFMLAGSMTQDIFTQFITGAVAAVAGYFVALSIFN